MIIIFMGIFGYQVIEGWSWIDAFYMTVISLTTVGFGETHPLSDAGKIFTIILILSGIGSFAFVIRSVSLEILSPFLDNVLKEKKMRQMLKKLSDHYIVCGYGRIGSDVSRNLINANKQVAIVDIKPVLDEDYITKQALYISGDASHEETLTKAGIQKAKGLISCVKSEAVNVFITLTARELNQKLYIISRYEEETTEKKLLRAGADKVVNPYHIGGDKISQLILKPTISKILDFAQKKGQFNLNIEELEILENSPLVGESIKSSHLKDNFNIIIIAVENENGNIITAPGPNYRFLVKDRLVMIANDIELSEIAKKYCR